MCANDLNGGHLNDENMAHTVDKVQHADTVGLRHSPKVQMLRRMMAVERSDYLHPCQDFVFSIWFDDFETRFLPIVGANKAATKTKKKGGEWNKVMRLEIALIQCSANVVTSCINRTNMNGKTSNECTIITWVSVRLRLKARLRRSHTDRYRVVLNLFSSETNCSYVNAVRALEIFIGLNYLLIHSSRNLSF